MEPFSVRDMKLLIWAAKAHVHYYGVGWTESTLIHSKEEVQAAIDRCERDNPRYRNEPATDEGVRAHNH